MRFNDVPADYFLALLLRFEQQYGLDSATFYIKTRRNFTTGNALDDAEWLSIWEWVVDNPWLGQQYMNKRGQILRATSDK